MSVIETIKAKLTTIERVINTNNDRTKKEVEIVNEIKDDIAKRTGELRVAEGKKLALQDEGIKLMKRKHEIETELQKEEQRADRAT